ncbi:MAG TPA: hypothetical protein VGM98_24590 [Schlesneria sp.]
MTKTRLKAGSAYSFFYPRHNYAGIRSPLEQRCVLVISVRDTRAERLDPTTRRMNPRLNRGRWLMTGQDLDKGTERSFYVSSMRNIQPVKRDQQPLASSRFAVIDRNRVAFSGGSLGEALAYVLGSGRGVLCGVLQDHRGED